jgi:signal transduction histidine kinase
MAFEPDYITPEILFSRFGEYLVEKGLISDSDLQNALARQVDLRKQGRPVPLVGNLLIEQGAIDRPTLDRALTEQIMTLRSALQDANQKLEIRVQQRTSELQDAIQRLAEMNDQKANFVANISHELRTPLTHQRGYVDLLISGELGELNSEQKQALNVIDRSTDRLAHLIEDLILFSSAEQGQVFIRVRPFELKNLVYHSATYGRAQASLKSIQFSLESPEDLPIVQADEEKITWVISQLLDNALKFTPQGGTITLGVEVEHNLVMISISDDGIGIPFEKIPHVFEPFYQIDGSSTRKAGGMGLGLALVKKIIEAHGSVINLTSSPGHGSRFEFVLKIAEKSQSI